MALTVSARSRWTGPSTPTLIRVAASCAGAGIALSLTADYGDYGKWLTVVGVILLLLSLHRFGRSGPDETIVFELGPRRKKKRKLKPTALAGNEAEAPSADS